MCVCVRKRERVMVERAVAETIREREREREKGMQEVGRERVRCRRLVLRYRKEGR